MNLGSFLVYFVPIVLAAATLEGIVLTRRGRAYDWRAYLTSLGDVIGRNFIRVALPLNLAAPAIAWTAEHRLFTVPLGPVWGFVLLFLGQEFCYYWYHRTSHRVRWFWATHVVHHSPNELNFSAAYRIGWTGMVTGTLLFFVPLIWIGFPAQAVVACLSLNLLYQFWLHADWIPKLGWLEYVLNTPSHHRVHHAANLPYLDANYGGVLILFDRMFGTFVAEREDLACRYGLVHPVTTYNTLAIELHEWLAIARDLRRARGWGERLGYVFGPPGWQPGGVGATTEAVRRLAPTGAD